MARLTVSVDPAAAGSIPSYPRSRQRPVQLVLLRAHSPSHHLLILHQLKHFSTIRGSPSQSGQRIQLRPTATCSSRTGWSHTALWMSNGTPVRGHMRAHQESAGAVRECRHIWPNVCVGESAFESGGFGPRFLKCFHLVINFKRERKKRLK